MLTPSSSLGCVTDASLWLQAGHAWWVLHCDPETKGLERPFVVRFDHCTDVAVHDVSLRHPCLKAAIPTASTASTQTTTTRTWPVSAKRAMAGWIGDSC